MGDNHGFSRLMGASRFHWAKPVCGKDWKMKMARVSCLLNTPPEPEASFVDPMSEPGPSEPKKKKPKRCE